MIKRVIVTLMLVVLLTGVVMAQEQGVQILDKLFGVKDSEVAELFDKSFLSQVPAEQIVEILKTYQGKLGRLQEVTGNNGSYTLVFEKGTAPAKLSLTTDDKIAGLWFGNWTLDEDTGEGILSEFKSLEGSVSVSVIKNNQESILSYNANKKMAVGSSFKLLVLKAVYAAVEKGDLSWDSIVKLKPEDKTLPSGILQNWPDDTPLTLKTLTNLMISMSDNTATDILIEKVGRRNIESLVSEENLPFLKTNELFKLKYAADSSTREQYLEADLKTRRQILDNIQTKIVTASMISNSPTLIEELEWFFTTTELCKTIYDLRDAEELRINPGLVVKEDWYLVGYKGGSEPGVLQYTHLLQKEVGGDFYAISVTINNPEKAVNTSKFIELTTRLISLVRKGEL